MKVSTASLAIAANLFLSTCTEAVQLHKRTDGPARVVGLPVQRKLVLNPLLRDKLRRRDGAVQATLANEETLYFANVTLGTPPQSLRLQLDTGSSDLWVNTPTSALCKSEGSPCAAAGTYVANSSSTYTYVASDFNITYVDGTGALGDYATDTCTIAGTTLPTLQFGIGYTSSSDEGLLGVGYTINEAQVGRAGKAPYDNLPAQMLANGLIESNAYSLWLNDLEASTGSILFGGVDTDKYHGSLETLPVQKVDGYYAEFLITLTEVQFGSAVIAEDQALAVLLDSGTSLIYLPEAMTAAIYEEVDAEYDASAGAAYVPCSLASNTTTLNFTFSSPTIAVAMSELVLEVASSNGEPLTFSDGTKACLFGITPGGSSTSILGDIFLRSAYVVYDLSNNEISIAQTNFDATSSNVLEIGQSVPDATAVADPAAATAGLDGGSFTGGIIEIGGTATSKAAAASSVAPVALAVMAAMGAGVFYASM